MSKFETIKKAGITPGVLAKLLDVSRVTASQWMNGHASPHRLLEGRVETLLKEVDFALAQGLLPLAIYPGRSRVLDSVNAALATARVGLNASQT